MYKLEDKKIIFENDELFPHLPHLGDGAHSDVYKFRIGKEIYALKVYNGLFEESLENIENLSNIKIDSYISPIKLLYIKSNFNGYLMKLCRGGDLQKRRKIDITIDEFAQSSVKLFDDTKKLTELKYSIFDSYISNVMYDNGFKMIDMDEYPYQKDKKRSEIEFLNNRRLNQMLVDVFINSTGLASIFFENVELKKLMAYCTSGKILFEELFNKICMLAYDYASEELTDVKDVGNVLRKSIK